MKKLRVLRSAAGGPDQVVLADLEANLGELLTKGLETSTLRYGQLSQFVSLTENNIRVLTEQGYTLRGA